jgi:hypothetical protein
MRWTVLRKDVFHANGNRVTQIYVPAELSGRRVMGKLAMDALIAAVFKLIPYHLPAYAGTAMVITLIGGLASIRILGIMRNAIR